VSSWCPVPANQIAYAQGLKQIDLANAQLATADQDLILRSPGVFDAGRARQRVTFIKAQKRGGERAAGLCQAYFEVAPPPTQLEAQARFDSGRARNSH
jgi:outer membrane protein